MTDTIAYVGARTTKDHKARDNGLNVYRVPRGGGEWQRLPALGDLVNPFFLAFDPTRRSVFVAMRTIASVAPRMQRLRCSKTRGANWCRQLVSFRSASGAARAA
jgi:6-phosphogluconolactonase (cycloisomerase 2 family)